PPAADRLRGKLCRVMVNPDTDPASVVCQVRDPVGNGVSQLLVLEVIHSHFDRLPARPPLAPALLEIAYQFALFRVDRDHWLSSALEGQHLVVDLLKLSVTIRVLTTFFGLSIGLQAIVQLVQEPGHSPVADLMSLALQFISQLAATLGCPAQGRSRRAKGRSFEQFLQVTLQATISRLKRLAPSSRAAQAGLRVRVVCQQRGLLQFFDPSPDRRLGQSSRSGDGGNSSPTNSYGFASSPVPPHLFVHHRSKSLVFGAHLGNGFIIYHTAIIAVTQKFANLFWHGSLGIGYNKDGQRDKQQMVLSLLCARRVPVWFSRWDGDRNDNGVWLNDLKPLRQRLRLPENALMIGDRKVGQKVPMLDLGRHNWRFLAPHPWTPTAKAAWRETWEKIESGLLTWQGLEYLSQNQARKPTEKQAKDRACEIKS